MNLLILDDDPSIQILFKTVLGNAYTLFLVSQYDEAIERLESEEIDGAIVDIDLKDAHQRTGVDFLRAFKQRFGEKPIVMASGLKDINLVVECMKLGAEDYLEKPFEDRSSVKLRVDKVFLQAQQKRVFHRAFEKATVSQTIIGESPKILKAKQLVEHARDLRILLTGETGVGKTPFAQYSNSIVSQLQGQPRPFEQLNCAFLQKDRFQDELFGHKKGAFTTALSDKRGIVELAKGGDLFLDEIGEMPLDTQALFLTFLDSMEYYRLGEDRKRKADVRIICATNRDLKQMVKQGLFRQDLYSRIAQIVIPVPPLRERTEDIRALLEHFIRLFTGSNKSYDSEIIRILEGFTWEEGNVRELKDAVEYMCIMSKDSERIEVQHLSDQYRPLENPGLTVQAFGPSFSDFERVYDMGLEVYLGHVEKNLLEKLTAENAGTVDHLAKRLQVSRPTLYRRLKKYELISGKAQ